MRRAFVGNLFLLLFLNFLVKPFWIFGIDRTIQNEVGAEVYGMYYALFNLSFLFNILLDLGINNYNSRNIAQNHKLVGKNLLGVAYLKLGGAVLFFLITLSVGYFLGYSMQEMQLLVVLCFNMFILSAVLFLRSNLAGLQKFKLDSVVSVLDRTVLIGICAYLLWMIPNGSEFQIEWLVYAQTAAYGFTFVVALICVMMYAKNVSANTNFVVLVSIIKQSLPYALIILFMTIYYKMDAVMLDRMLEDGAYQAGIYAQGYRILDAFNMVGYLFVTLLFPLFSKILADKQDYLPVLKLSTRLLLTFSIAVAALSLLYANEIMNLLYIQIDDRSALVFAILLLSFIPISFINIYGSLLTANGNLTDYNRLAFGGILLNFILNVSLIPYFTAMGSAIATLMTNLFIALGVFYFLSKRLNLNADRKLLFKFGFLFSTLVVAGLGLEQIDVIDWWLKLFICSMVGIPIAFGLKIVGTKSVRDFLSYRFRT